MKFYIQDHTTGYGGGQRWTRMLGRWLVSRGHEVQHGGGEHGISCDAWLDMGPAGDANLYPTVPVYLWCHVPSHLRHFRRAMDRVQVIASSRWSACRVREVWGVEPIVLPLFTDAQPVAPSPGPRRILFVGRLTRAKGAFLAVETYRDSNLSCGLTLAGATWSTPPEDLDDLRELVESAPGARLIEDPPADELESLYESHHVFWSMAGKTGNRPTAEAFGLAAADAFVRGLTVLSFPLGAIPEWLPERFWIHKSADAFVRKTQEALAGTIDPPTEAELTAVSSAPFSRAVEQARLEW